MHGIRFTVMVATHLYALRIFLPGNRLKAIFIILVWFSDSAYHIVKVQWRLKDY